MIGKTNFKSGDRFKAKCPSECLMDNQVYGNMIYHPMSYLCAAARHAGVLAYSLEFYIQII